MDTPTIDRGVLSILVIDNDERVRQGLQRRMERTGDIRVAAVAGLGDDVAALARRLSPDVVLLELRGPDGAALALCRELSEIAPVLILSSYLTPKEWGQARAAGASDFHLKQIGLAGLVEKIRAVREEWRQARGR